MLIELQTFQEVLQRSAAALQAAGGRVFDLRPGSVIRAVLEANAAIALWIQWLIVKTLGMTRAATSSGADLDSWMADFGLGRLGPVAADGIVTFSRFSPRQLALIPVGTRVRTNKGGITYSVIKDAGISTWQEEQGAYGIPAGVSAVDLPVIADVAGVAGNIDAGAIGLISTALPGVDNAINNAPFGGGLDGEDDDRLRQRFVDFINSRSLATISAIEYAIASSQPGLRYQVYENSDAQGNEVPGQFLVVADNGRGDLSNDDRAAIYAAVDGVRPIGSRFTIVCPATLIVDISVNFSNPINAADAMSIRTAIGQYVDQLPIGSTLSRTRLTEAAYRSAKTSQYITGVTINGIPADLIGPRHGVLVSRTITVV